MTPPNTEITPSRHTPEWKVNRIDYPRKMDVSFEVLDEHGEIVCQTIMREIATEQERITEDEKHVKLFAAAPDMLSALKAAVADAEKAVNPSARLFGYAEMKAAISKAEKQP